MKSIFTTTARIVHRCMSYFFYNASQVLSLLALLLCISNHVSAQDELMGVTSNGGPEGRGTVFSIKTNNTGFALVKSFADWGDGPLANLVKGADGALYGTTYQGGTYGYGTIFKITTSGALTIVKQLDFTNDGGYPKGSLLLAKDGNFYGYVTSGTLNNGGGIFKLTPAGVYSIVHSLSVNAEGGRPQGKLIQGTDGNFYGMNYGGGTNGYGTIFKLTSTGTYTVLKHLSKADGGNPYGSLIQGKDGVLYGMTYWGGTAGYGTIFKITTAGVYTILKSLNSATDGAYPYGDLLQAKDGLLWGMTSSGGANYNGTIFKITTAGTFTVVRSLNTGTDGGSPTGNLVQATDGNFYGMQKYTSGGTHGCVFKMTPAGTYTVLKKFDQPTTGGYPNGSLFQNSDGSFYGMTNVGGKNFVGTVFKVTSTGTLTVLSHLNGATLGNEPQENLVAGKDSALYGMTRYGGTYNFGTIFKICGGVTTVVRSFNKTTDGATPGGGLVRASDGNFYGMTESGGTYSMGTIFKLTATGTFSVLKHFSTATDGAYPKGTLVQGTDGALYGITSAGGSANAGTVFRITTAGSFKVLRHLVAATDGSASEGSLTVGKDGNLYGLTSYNSRFFKITNTGTFTVLKTLVYASDGNGFAGSLVIGKDGNFYGANGTGGRSSAGTIFKLTTAGVLTVLRSLTPATDGSSPKGSLVQAADGYLYGVTSTGGTYKAGTIFKISTTGTFSVLRHFNLVKDGGTPLGGLIIAPKNNLVANAIKNVAVTEDVAKAIVLSGNGSSLQKFTISTAPKNGTVTGSGANWSYKPKANFNGLDSFYYTVSVGCVSSKPAVVTLVIAAVNDAPVLDSIRSKTAVKGTALTFTATASDVDAGQTKKFSLVTPPAGATINATSGVFTWTPAAAGTFTFKVRVTDNGSPVLYDEETIKVTVANTLAARTTEEKTETIDSNTKLPGIVTGKLHPNPVTTGKCTIMLDEDAQKVNTLLLDIRGTVVASNRHRLSGYRQLEMDLTNIAAGQYIIVVQTESGRNTFKLIKQ